MTEDDATVAALLTGITCSALTVAVLWLLGVVDLLPAAEWGLRIF
jgi:hypothetical protein